MKTFLVLCLIGLVSLTSATDVIITELKQSSSTLNTISLSWILSPPLPAPSKYVIVTNGFLKNEFLPPSDNTHVVPGLTSCTSYDFALSAVFADGSETEPSLTSGTTTFETPDAISDLAVDTSKNALLWTAPANERCVDHYNVCWRSTQLLADYCDTTPTPSFSLATVSGCDSVLANVSAVSGGVPLTGPGETLRFETVFGEPGAPRNFEVVSLPGFAAQLLWDDPAENAACILSHNINYGPYMDPQRSLGHPVSQSSRRSTHVSMRGLTRVDDEALVSNLTACTNLLFDLSFISIQDTKSESAYENMTTDYISPGAITDVKFDATVDTIKMTWDETLQDGCLAYLELCYTDASTKLTECQNATDPQLDREVIIEGLSACRHYEFVVAGVSVTGEFGPPTTHEVVMDDMAPGPVQNLEIDSATATTIVVSYDPPMVRPECVVEYVTSRAQLIPDLRRRNLPAAGGRARERTPRSRARREALAARSEGEFVAELKTMRSGSIKDNLMGLEACSDYKITVHAASGSHQAGNETLVMARTSDEIPGPPTDMRAVTATDSSITFTWFAPDNRFCASSYEVGYSPMNSGQAQVTETVENSDFSLELLHTLRNLAKCTSYVINVSSKGALGASKVGVLTQATQC